MPHSHFSNFGDFRGYGQQIIEVGGRVITDVHFRHNQHLAGIFDRFVIVSNAPQHLDTTAFKIVQIVGVMNASLAVGLLVRDAEFELMSKQLRRCRGGRGLRQSSSRGSKPAP